MLYEVITNCVLLEIEQLCNLFARQIEIVAIENDLAVRLAEREYRVDERFSFQIANRRGFCLFAGWRKLVQRVITSYSIHYTKLYEFS